MSPVPGYLLVIVGDLDQILKCHLQMGTIYFIKYQGSLTNIDHLRLGYA